MNLIVVLFAEAMNFTHLTEEECGQTNSFSQLIQNVTENRTFHESIGNTSTLGYNQNNLMPRQSLRMDGDYLFGWLLSPTENNNLISRFNN